MNGDDPDNNGRNRAVVFESFKNGVNDLISPDDVTTHYDLGVAYLDMGLLEDAITEFEVVLRAAPTHAAASAALRRATARLRGPPKSDPSGAA